VVIATSTMVKRTQESYEEVFDALNEGWKKLGLIPKFKSILVDYEKPEMNAAMKKFGKKVSVHVL
jgi:hypothetical protein